MNSTNIRLAIKYSGFILMVFIMGFFVMPKASFSRNDSSDVIAVRVVPNPNHYSVTKWYASQGFRGTPQALKVDEYRALRDGNTVYVNAANITGACVSPAGKVCSDKDDCNGSNPVCNLTNFYTNVYVIAKNIEADNMTENIFLQVLNSFKINNNVGDIGYCSQREPVSCNTNVDCGENQQCEGNECVLGCSYDYECPIRSYCDSDKAQVIRDVKRLGDLADIREALNDYREINGHYPKLEAGTYVPNMTISVWPSWQQTLAKELNVSMLPVDPVNVMGECGTNYPSYSEATPPSVVTCWDEVNKVFADANPTNANPLMPADTFVYMYATDPDGLGFGIQ